MDKYAKALVAAALAVLAALLPAVGDGHITATEIVIMVTAGIATLATIWGVPNATAPVPAPMVPASALAPMMPYLTMTPPATPGDLSVPQSGTPPPVAYDPQHDQQ